MQVVIAIISLAILAVCVIRGYHRGLLGILYGIGSWIFIFVFVAMVNPPLHESFMTTPEIHDNIYQQIEPYVQKYVPMISTVVVPQPIRAASNLPDLSGIQDQLEENNISQKDINDVVNGESTIKEKLKERGIEIPDEYKDKISEYQKKLEDSNLTEILGDQSGTLQDALDFGLTDGANTIRQGVVSSATETIVGFILKIIAIIVSYIFAKIVCIALRIGVEIILNVPVMGKGIKIAGGIFGVVEAALYLNLLLFALKVVSTFPIDIISEMDAAVRSTPILSFMYENNILQAVLSNL